MILILNNLIADLNQRLEAFPVQAQDLKPVGQLDIGPGGACNVAIMAARFGLSVGALGEWGDDLFGQMVRAGLEREGIATHLVVVSAESRTPVAGVLVDAASEPAYLGFPGVLTLQAMPLAWREAIVSAEALFTDGWIEYPAMAGIILEALRLARAHGVPTFFDPGPGNPAQDNAWHVEATRLARVVLANEQEAARLTSLDDPLDAGRALLHQDSDLVIIKRGSAGCVLLHGAELQLAAGFPVHALDATGAGDSLAGAIIYGYLTGLDLPSLGLLANATGAAKVRKFGTGHNLPTLAEIRQLLARFGLAVSLPAPPDR